MASPVFDYSKGKVVVQHGTIFYSPNCNRAVDIPPQSNHSFDPFKQPRLNASLFKQPVWWLEGWAWQSFIPLAPSFLFTPFESLCAMPRIEEVKLSFLEPSGQVRTEIAFRMPEDDIQAWLREEARIVKLAHLIKLRYGISANPPPKPSSFHFDRPHKSHSIAKRMICVAREWFAIWMGHISYLIAKTEILVPNGEQDRSSPAPDWYNHLLKYPEFNEAWLDGLSLSAACTFDQKTPRAGIIFQWSDAHKHREPIQWFYDHHIPLWFIWSNKEEQAISKDHSLAHLRPPEELVEEALTLLFSTPNVPLAGLVMQRYFRLGDPITNKTVEFLRLQHAPSFVFEFTSKLFLSQEPSLHRFGATADARLSVLKASRDNEIQVAAQAASSFPYHGLLVTVEERGKLYNHYDDFFAARQKRQEEMMKVESAQDRQRRESRAKNPGTINTKMYVWEKTQSSGGLELYKRVKVNKKENEDVYAYYRSHQRLFNAFSNEWDFCEDFCFGPVDDSYESDDEYDDDDGYGDQGCSADFISQPTQSPPLDTPMDVESDPTRLGHHFSRDAVETMSLVYGYVPFMEATDRPSEHEHMGASYRPSEHKWDAILKFLGFVKDLQELDVPELEKRAMMNHFSALVSQKEADRVVAKTFGFLSDLFNFKHVSRPSTNLFIFSSPPSNACQWVLGVDSPVSTLYVCRYIIENPQAHTILTVANRLLDRGIPFRTLLPLHCSPRQSTFVKPYTPKAYRLDNHKFTKADFDVAMLACQSVLTLPQGRAALLRGGIVGRIAMEYLSKDGVLDGPSLEVTVHRVGYLGPSGQGDTKFCDDHLTEDEIAVICGTYSLYIRRISVPLCFLYFLICFTAYAGQVAVRSWFPPPSAWTATRSGCSWLEWTERCEDIYLNIINNIREGKGTPKSHADWISFLQGQKIARALVNNNSSLSQRLMDSVVPVGQCR
jgi:hypothetical protein